MVRSFRLGLALVIAAAAAIGCTGVIGADDGSSATGGGGPNGGPPGTGPGPGPGTGTSPVEALVESTRFPRLTHLQWENTIKDLLRLGAKSGLSSSFTSDPPGSTFGNDGRLLQVTPGLWGDYQRAAEELSTKLTTDAAMLTKILPAGIPASGDERAIAFIKDFGKRAFRRPLDEATEVPEYLALFKSGNGAITTGDAFSRGAAIVVQQMLQSPFFVYRVEIGTPVEGAVALTDYEIATKLSYALWNTMPDDELFRAADAKELVNPENLAKQARRMLDDARAEPMISHFHDRLFQLDHIDTISGKDATMFPEWSAQLPAMMKQETDLFVRDVVITQKAGLSELLTADYSFVNDKLAKIYGVSGTFGTELKKTKLDPTQRAGFLTQVGFLAANASPREPDPIHRGVFINLRVICANLPPPPDVIPPLPPAGGRTNRERVAAHTGKGTCGAGCHGTMINPAGFAFENYDALGKWRTTDNGQPVNATDTYPFEDGPQTYNGAVEFSKVLAKRPQVHRCYTSNWLEYTFGRAPAEGDAGLIDRVGKTSLAGASVKELIVNLLQSKSFTHRPAVAGGG